VLSKQLGRVNLYPDSEITLSTGKFSPGYAGNESSADERDPAQTVNASAGRRTKKIRNFSLVNSAISGNIAIVCF